MRLAEYLKSADGVSQRGLAARSRELDPRGEGVVESTIRNAAEGAQITIVNAALIAMATDFAVELDDLLPPWLSRVYRDALSRRAA